MVVDIAVPSGMSVYFRFRLKQLRCPAGCEKWSFLSLSDVEVSSFLFCLNNSLRCKRSLCKSSQCLQSACVPAEMHKQMHLWCVEIVWAFRACEDESVIMKVWTWSDYFVSYILIFARHAPKLTLGATYWQARELPLKSVVRWAQWSRQCNFVMAQLWILIIRVPKQRSAKNTVENPGPAVTDSACIFYRVLNFTFVLWRS